MSIVKRMRDLGRASWNDMLEKVEDPVRFLDRYLAEQTASMRDLDQLYQQTLKHTHVLRKQYLDADHMVGKREEQAALALKAGEENLARLALQEKISYEEKADQYKRLYEQGKETSIELEDQLTELHTDIQEASEKREYFKARLQSLQLQKQLDARRATFGSDSFSWMNRLETAIHDLEIESSVYRESRGYSSTNRKSQTHAEQSIEKELQKLRQKLKLDTEGRQEP